MEDEIWKPIPGYDGYEVSDLGRVRSWRYGGGRGCYRRQVPLLMKPRSTWTNELSISLRKDGKDESCYVHRLVMLAFVGQRPAGMQICHWDGDPTNNRPDNLRYDTVKANAADTARHGRRSIGEHRWNHRLSESDVLCMREQRAAGSRLIDLSAQYHISVASVGRTVTGVTWRHVGGPRTRKYSWHASR